MDLSRFSLQDKIAVVTGATGVLGGAIARGLADAGATVGILGRRSALAEETSASIRSAGGAAFALPADVLDESQLTQASARIAGDYGRLDILVNCAGGNVADATIVGERTFFNMPREAFEQVLSLNLTGSLLPSQIFGRLMVEGRDAGASPGSIINISSMAAFRAMTRVLGYGVAKAGIDSFTYWLATDFAKHHQGRARVNAIAPGFFIGDQNRALLLNEDGSLTARGRTIIERTPMGRFGEPEELVGTAVWLASDASRFVTGVVVPVDGGFLAYTGV